MSQMSSRESESHLQAPLDSSVGCNDVDASQSRESLWPYHPDSRSTQHDDVVIGGSDLIGAMDSKTLTGQSQ